MDQLSHVLSRVLAKRGLNVHAHAAHVVHRSQLWLSERLPQLRNHIVVKKFEEGTLFIACGHSIAAQECHPLSGDLQAYLLKECRFSDIKEVRISRQ